MIGGGRPDEVVGVSNRVRGLHGGRERVQGGDSRIQIGHPGERPRGRPRQVPFPRFTLQNDGMQGGDRRTGRLDDCCDRVFSNEFSLDGSAAGLDG